MGQDKMLERKVKQVDLSLDADTYQMVTIKSYHHAAPVGQEEQKSVQAAPVAEDEVSLEEEQLTEAPEISATQQKTNSFDEKTTEAKDKLRVKAVNLQLHGEALAFSMTEKFREKKEKREAEKQAKARVKTMQAAHEEREKQRKAEEKHRQEVDAKVEKIRRYFTDEGGDGFGRISGSDPDIFMYREKGLYAEGVPDEQYRKSVTRLMDHFHKGLFTRRKKGSEEFSEGGRALLFYSTKNFEAMNDIMRTGDSSRILPGQTKEHVTERTRTVVSFLNTQTVPQDMVTVRHVGLDALPYMLGPGDYSTVEKALESKAAVDYQERIATDAAVTSTTTMQKGVKNFAEKGKVEIRAMIPKGTHACFMKEVSEASHEDELLLQAGTKFRVLKMERADDGPGPDGSYPKVVLYVEAMKDNTYDMGKFPAAS
ncbi:MAG: ADP-ribosyltransferase [Lachnospiraceae bacterium]|nr:ADP-ribosyltransferase [Lachnospiraceae bacterium]